MARMLRTIRPSRRLRVLVSEKKMRDDFAVLTADIVQHPVFRKLRHLRHHAGSLYDHAVAVAFLSYRFSRKWHLNYRSVARGALFHDFILYDWRKNEGPSGRSWLRYLSEHPGHALANAKSLFAVNAVERDIILKHSWPCSLRIPRYRETVIVCCADKLIILQELIDRWLGKPPRMPGSKVMYRTRPAEKFSLPAHSQWEYHNAA
jgi:uncharacterized protein